MLANADDLVTEAQTIITAAQEVDSTALGRLM